MNPRGYRWAAFLLGVALLGQCAGPQLLHRPSAPSATLPDPAASVVAAAGTPMSGCVDLAFTVTPAAALTGLAALLLLVALAVWRVRRAWQARIYGHRTPVGRLGYGPRLPR